MRIMVSCLMIAGLVLAGCEGPAPEDPNRPKVVGLTLLTQTHSFFQDMVDEMQQEAKKHNLVLKVQYAEFNANTQNNHLETFMAQKVDAIVLSPADSSGFVPVIAEARGMGIPVFTVDIAALGADVLSHIASDNEKGGELAGEYLAGLLDGKGNVAVIDNPEVTSVQDRTRGFDRAMAKYPGITEVARVPGDGRRDRALRAAQDILQAHPDLDGIFGINDDSALGALAAVETAGLQDKIVIVGFDGSPEARDMILKGTALKADVVQYPRKIAQTAIQTVAAYLGGAEVDALIPVEVGVIDQASLQAEQAKAEAEVQAQ